MTSSLLMSVGGGTGMIRIFLSVVYVGIMYVLKIIFLLSRCKSKV